MKPVKLKEYFNIFAGTFLLAIAINCFFAPMNLVTGGFSGLSIILNHTLQATFGLDVPIWLIMLVLNIPLFLFAALFNGFSFVSKSIYAFAALTISLFCTRNFPNLSNNDYFLTAIFGGALAGAGLGLVLRYDSSTGGTDTIAMILSEINKHIPSSQFLFIIDFAIITLGFYIFDVNSALYGIVAIFITTKVIDAMLEGIAFAKAIFIISDKCDEISKLILSDIDRGVTALYGQGMYTGKDKKIAFCVLSKKELVRLKAIVNSIDPTAFLIVADVREVQGEGFHK